MATAVKNARRGRPPLAKSAAGKSANPVGRPAKKSVGRPSTKKSPGRPASSKSAGRPAGKVGRPAKKAVGRPAKKSVGRPAKKAVGRPAKKTVGRPANSGASTVKKSAGRPPAKRGPGRPPAKKGATPAKKSPGRPAGKSAKNKLGVKNSLVNNINAKKASGTSKPRSKSSVSRKSYKKMEDNWEK